MPEVAGALQGEAGPTALLYCNVPQIFDKLYPLLPMAAMYCSKRASIWTFRCCRRPGIRKHLTPLVTTVRRTKAGIEIDEQ